MALTFRARLTIWYVATITCLLALTATGLLYALDRIAQKKFDAGLWMLGAAEAENITASLRERGLDRPDNSTVINYEYRKLLRYTNGPLEKYVTIVDDTRHVADFTTNLKAPLPVDTSLLERSFTGEVVYQTVNVSGIGSLRVVYMPVRAPQAVVHPFVVMVGLPEKFVGGEMKSFKIMVALAFITLVLLTGASAMLLAERAIKPIEEITAAAEAINPFNLSARLPKVRALDQIGRLIAVFNQMIARLESAFEAQRHFTARAAHELRTPLTILKGETQVALRRKRTASEYENLLRSNLEEIDKLVVMIDDLLLLARYEGGETRMPHETVRLDEVVEAVAHDIRSLALEKEIALDIETKKDLCVNGDPKALERLVRNVMENAVYYTHRGGRVSARVKREGERINLTVEDNGIGIKPEELQHIFQRFYRSSTAREMRPEGSGIGLAMSALIVHSHGAAINITSNPGTGTRFTISFPPDTRQDCEEAE